jgi:hypothetical protein
MKNFNDTIENRTRDLPACSAVPEPTAPPRAPFIAWYLLKKCAVCWELFVYDDRHRIVPVNVLNIVCFIGNILT